MRFAKASLPTHIFSDTDVAPGVWLKGMIRAGPGTVSLLEGVSSASACSRSGWTSPLDPRHVQVAAP
jgi:hypothetical protein